jgi:hypothetical protein
MPTVRSGGRHGIQHTTRDTQLSSAVLKIVENVTAAKETSTTALSAC